METQCGGHHESQKGPQSRPLVTDGKMRPKVCRVLLEATRFFPCLERETQEVMEIVGCLCWHPDPHLMAHALFPSPPQSPVPGAHRTPQLPPSPGRLCGHLHPEPQPDDLWPCARRECPLEVGWGCTPAGALGCNVHPRGHPSPLPRFLSFLLLTP